MKKRLTILTCLMLVCTFMFGQNQGPDWGEYYGKPYENGSSMTFTVSVAIDGELQNHTDLEVAPYSDGKRYGNPVRLTQAPAFLGGKYIAQLIVNAPANSEIRFRMYDYRTNSMFEDYSQESFVFEAGIVGNAQTPQVINFATPVTYVAQIGEEKYETFDDAYKAAKSGDVIELLETAVITNSNPWINYSTKNITVKANLGKTAFRIQDNAYVWLGGMTIESNDYCITVGAADGSSGANVEIYGGTYKGNVSAISVTKGYVKIMDGTFSVEPYQGSYEYTINCIDSYYNSKDAKVSIQGGKFYNFNPQDNAAEGSHTNFLASGYFAVEGEDNYWTVVEGKAKIGNVYYASLADAIAAAEENETVELYKGTSGSGIVINKSITIDFKGLTYSFNKGVGSTGTESNGFQILKGNTVVLKNGTLNVSRNYASKFYILVQNYADLTVENMKLDGTYLDKWSTIDGDSYVLSNNSGNVNIVKTTITANNDGDKAFAFDVCKKASYEAPVVNLDAESTINGKVELSGGQFYPKQGVTVTLTKSIDPYDLENELGWYTISAPFATDFAYNGDEDEYTLFRYDEKTATWENHKAHEYFGLELGRGYLYANLPGNDLTLEGVANVDKYTTSLTYESAAEELKGNHLLGNPYTFDITGNHLAGDIEGGFYQMAGNGAWVPNELTAEIAVGEGFLVQANSATDFAINKTATEPRSADNGSLQINVANDVYSDVAYVSFNEGVGLSKISHQNANIPMVYVPVENNDYAIAYLGENVEEVPFSFEAKTMGTYTISVKAQNCEFSTMTLVDRFTGVETNLLFEDYSFVAKSSDNSDRFILRLSRGTTNLEEEHFAYINNNGLIINNASGNATLQIFDVMGRPVSSHNVSGNANIAMESLTNGVYILRLIDDNNVRIQKVVID